MSRLALATPLLPLVSCFCCIGLALASRGLMGVADDLTQRMIRTVPIPLAAVGISLVALVRILRHPLELRGLGHALLGLVLNLGVLVVAVIFAWVGDWS